MTFVAATTLKLCVTGAAGENAALPDCVAVIEHRPGDSSVAMAPETLQTAGVFDANVTVRPELALADRLTEPPVTGWLGMGAKLIDCGGRVTFFGCTAWAIATAPAAAAASPAAVRLVEGVAAACDGAGPAGLVVAQIAEPPPEQRLAN